MEEYGMIILVAMFVISILTGVRIGSKDSFEQGRAVGIEEGRIKERNEINAAIAKMRVREERISGFDACKLYEFDNGLPNPSVHIPMPGVRAQKEKRA